MPATLEIRTCQLLIQFLPIRQFPCIDGVIFDFMAQVWHMFRSECFVYQVVAIALARVLQSAQYAYSRSLTDTISSTSIGGLPFAFS